MCCERDKHLFVIVKKICERYYFYLRYLLRFGSFQVSVYRSFLLWNAMRQCKIIECVFGLFMRLILAIGNLIFNTRFPQSSYKNFKPFIPYRIWDITFLGVKFHLVFHLLLCLSLQMAFYREFWFSKEFPF